MDTFTYGGMTFTVGKTYYMVDKYPEGPFNIVLLSGKCVKLDPNEWDYSWGIEEETNHIPSPYPLGRTTNPIEISGAFDSDKVQKSVISEYFFDNLIDAQRMAMKLELGYEKRY